MKAVERRRLDECPEVVAGKIKTLRKWLGKVEHPDSPTPRKRRRQRSFLEVKFVFFIILPKLPTLTPFGEIILSAKEALLLKREKNVCKFVFRAKIHEMLWSKVYHRGHRYNVRAADREAIQLERKLMRSHCRDSAIASIGTDIGGQNFSRTKVPSKHKTPQFSSVLRLSKAIIKLSWDSWNSRLAKYGHKSEGEEKRARQTRIILLRLSGTSNFNRPTRANI
uniref:AP2/ERF domain-containing protein n=1 Tax=Elaeophora elaphi TaxID=1147741 RepID=A0A158Q8N4_9BILA